MKFTIRVCQGTKFASVTKGATLEQAHKVATEYTLCATADGWKSVWYNPLFSTTPRNVDFEDYSACYDAGGISISVNIAKE